MIRVEELTKSYDGATTSAKAVGGITFEVAPGQVVTLLGPSGCGKTTTLRCIAGLVTPDEGTITLGERVVYSSSRRINVTPDKRNIGMVFQSYAIWPHLTVGENVAFPLRSQRRVNRSDIRKKVANALELVGLGDFIDRLAPNLSGGQQQRVALARAIVAEPDVLLLDEPLSNLDAKLRDDMRAELRSLQKRLGLTVCFVTHDQTEALGLADTVILMRSGVVLEQGSPLDLYNSPRHPYTASFLGSSNIWRSEVRSVGKGKATVVNAFGTFDADDPTSIARVGSHCDLFFRRHNIEVVTGAPSAANVATGRIVSSVFLGEHYQVLVSSGEEEAMLSVPAYNAPALAPGQDLSFAVRSPLLFEADSIPTFDAATDDDTAAVATAQPA